MILVVSLYMLKLGNSMKRGVNRLNQVGIALRSVHVLLSRPRGSLYLVMEMTNSSFRASAKLSERLQPNPLLLLVSILPPPVTGYYYSILRLILMQTFLCAAEDKGCCGEGTLAPTGLVSEDASRGECVSTLLYRYKMPGSLTE